MNTLTSLNEGVPDIRSLAIWLITLLIVGFGFRYVREIISLVLSKLYEFFIQHHAIDL